MLKKKKGQAAIEYILTTGFLFTAMAGFYITYTKIAPHQFEEGAKLILTVYKE